MDIIRTGRSVMYVISMDMIKHIKNNVQVTIDIRKLFDETFLVGWG